MNLTRLLDVRTWPDLATEAVLRAGGRLHGLEPPSDLPAEVRQRVTVRWPRAYHWPSYAKGGDQLRELLRRRVRLVSAQLPQPYRGTILTEFEVDGRVHKVAFNVADYPEQLDAECTRESLVTFKFQYRREGYGQLPVVPAGYLPASPMLYDLLGYLRRAKDRRPSLFDVYGRFSLEFSPGVRGDALRHLGRTALFRFHGGDRMVRYSRYLREIARSKICIDLPGQGPFCFRLVEYLAVGSCVVAMPHGASLQTPLVDGVHLAYCQDGPPDLIRRCRVLLEDPSRRRAMEVAAREFFDRYLHRDRLAAYYLTTVLAAAGET